jgi:hypothetical protein
MGDDMIPGMNTQQILTVLRTLGASQERLDNLIKHDAKLLSDMVAGKPVRICIRGVNLGRCYNGYTDVAVNYTGADEEKPFGMCGRVNPKKVGETDGVKWASFYYDIDSSD